MKPHIAHSLMSILVFAIVSLAAIAVSLLMAALPNAHGKKDDAPSSPGSPAPAAAIGDISPEEAMRRIGSGENAVLLDVRTPEEHAERRIPGSLLLPLASRDDMAGPAARLLPDKSAPLFVYCRSGRRSALAADILVELGYRNVFNLGGIKDWPYETESGK